MSDAADPMPESEASRLGAEIAARLNDIVDPCALSFGSDIGIVEMGLVPQLEVSADRIVIGFCPTFPGCLLIPSLLKAIEEKLLSLETGRLLTVGMAPDQLAWDPSHMSEEAQRKLRRARALRASSAAATRREQVLHGIRDANGGGEPRLFAEPRGEQRC